MIYFGFWNGNTANLEDMKFAQTPLNINSRITLINDISQSIVLTQSNVEGGHHKLPWRMRSKPAKTSKH